MQHLRSWQRHQSEKEIETICNIYGIHNWSINSEGFVDVDSHVVIRYNISEQFLLKFGKINGWFEISSPNNPKKLTTLEGGPRQVDGYNCSNNKLTNLKGAAAEISDSFFCINNELTTLEGIPEYIGNAFDCEKNKLTTLQGGPKIVKTSFNCASNQLTNLVGAPQVGEYFNCYDNKLTSFEGAPRIIPGNFYANTSSLITLKDLPESIAGESSDKWLIHKLQNGLLKKSLLSTIPDHALTPKLLSLIKKIAPYQYNLLKRRRKEDESWKTDLSADLGDLGF